MYLININNSRAKQLRGRILPYLTMKEGIVYYFLFEVQGHSPTKNG